MSNRVSAKFSELGADFGERAHEIVHCECERLSFRPEGEVWRGLVYERAKVGTVIVRGGFRGKAAVLKLQGLRPEIEEAEHIASFAAQNASRRVRAPGVYHTEPWDASRGYGLTIMEEVTALGLYEPPWADAAAREAWNDFYAEFRANAVRKPWLSPDEHESSTKRFLTSCLASWLEINAKGDPARRLSVGDQRALVAAFEELVDQYGSELPMVFGHGHLGPDDIRVEAPGRYVLFSNFFWSWRPRWYDLAFNVWACLMALWKESPPTIDHAERIVEEWVETYRELPMTRADHRFEEHVRFMILGRLVGTALVDLVVAERVREAEAKRTTQLEITHALSRRLIQDLR